MLRNRVRALGVVAAPSGTELSPEVGRLAAYALVAGIFLCFARMEGVIIAPKSTVRRPRCQATPPRPRARLGSLFPVEGDAVWLESRRRLCIAWRPPRRDDHWAKGHREVAGAYAQRT